MLDLLKIFSLCLIIAVSVINGESNSKAKVNDSSPVEKRASKNIFKVCYSVGCFELEEPWISKSRPLEVPRIPEVIKTKYYFYSRTNEFNPKVISFNTEFIFKKNEFDSEKKTVVIVESLHSGIEPYWFLILKDIYLSKEDVNVIIVNWSGGYADVNYFQAASDTRVVAKELIKILIRLNKIYKINPKLFHLVCFGLGAHICAYVGKKIKGIGRLTALDPAQPYFEGFPSKVRLNQTDATFVDVIHTNAKPFKPGFGFGMMQPHGHVDFYVNGGFDQPVCPPTLSESFYKTVISDLWKYPGHILGFLLPCDHLVAPLYFMEAVNETYDCTIYGFRSKTENMGSEKMQIASPICSESNCLRMGLYTEHTKLRGTFVVPTRYHTPVCQEAPWFKF